MLFRDLALRSVGSNSNSNVSLSPPIASMYPSNAFNYIQYSTAYIFRDFVSRVVRIFFSFILPQNFNLHSVVWIINLYIYRNSHIQLVCTPQRAKTGFSIAYMAEILYGEASITPRNM